MAEQKAIYRMNRVMQINEMDASAAQRNAGSKSAYFDILEDFYANFPTILDGFASPAVARDPDAFQKGILELQKHLLAIGASSLLFEAEKAADSLRRGEKRVAAERIHSLAAKVTLIRNKLEEARVAQTETADSGSADDSGNTRNVTAEATPHKTVVKPKAEPNQEEFGRIRDLIDRFETDEAANLVNKLSEATYTRAIDDTIKAIKTAMEGFDHDHAAVLAVKLVELAASAKPDAEPEASKKKILAIDDVPDILNTVRSVLKDKYIVYGVTNHMAALKFLTNNSADLILLDIEMPDMDGFTLLGIIRKIKAYEATPAVFLTGSVTVENVVKSRKAGGNDFIKKPLDVQVLLAKMAKYLD